jgi:hypothetical protein
MPIIASLADFVVPLLGGIERRWLGAGLLLLVVVLGAVVLSLLAQAVVGHIDLVGAFSPDPATATHHLGTFPFTIPLGGTLFVLYLEVAVVSGVPALIRHRARDGALVFLGCAVLALLVYLTLANWGTVPAPVKTALGLRDPAGPIDALELAGIVISISIWQVLYLFCGGAPISAIPLGWLRVLVANVVVIGLGISTYWLLRFPLHFAVPQIAALAAMIVVGVLVIGVLLGMPAAGPPGSLAPLGRLWRFSLVAAVALITYVILRQLGSALQPTWTVGSLDLWIAISGLNLLGGSIFLCCRVLRPVLEPAGAGAPAA